MRLVPKKNDLGVVFDDFFSFLGDKDFHFGNMKCDVAKKDGNFIMDIDLPGVDKKDITISLENGYVTVEAKREECTEENSNGNYIHRERFYGSTSRSFYVGDGISEDDIKASYKEGILTVIVPDMEAKKLESKKYITIA